MPPGGLEPPTLRLKGARSSIELRGLQQMMAEMGGLLPDGVSPMAV
jgi:hypothetical protein